MIIDDRMKSDLSRLDYSSGGRIRAIADRITTIDNPIFIIGLGGTGVNAILRTKRLIADRMQLEDRTDKPANVEYLAIDTDANAFNGSYMGMSLSEDERCVYKLQDIAGIVGNRDISMRDDIKQWFSNDVDVSLIKDGAGAYRQVGRFILFQNISTINSIIGGKIDRIRRKTSREVFVFVFTGIGGGTGSGTFIDMGYILKSIANNKGASIRTFLLAVMPDVNLQKVDSTSASATNIKRNGFAALKELDYLNNLKVHGKTLSVDYGGGVSVTDTQEPPYEITILFSGVDESNQIIDYENVMAVCSETVINFIANEQTDMGAEFTINSFLANIKSMTDAYEANLGDQKSACSYKYIIAGAASSYIPLDDLVSFFTYRIFNKMSEMWHKEVRKEDVEEIIKAFNVHPSSVYNSIRGKIRTRIPDLGGYGFDDYKSDNRGILTACKNALEKQVAEVDAAVTDFIANIKTQLEDPNNVIDTNYFVNLEYGPVVTQRMIYSTRSNDFTVTRFCLDARDSCRQKVSDQTALTQLSDKVTRADDIRNAGFLDKLNSKKLAKNHADDIETLFNTQINDYIYAKMSEAYQEIYNLFLDKNNAVYDKVKTIIEELHRLFSSYGNIRTNTHEEVTGASHVLSWNIIDVPEFIKTAETMMENDPNLKVSIDDAVAGFYNDFIKNVDKWTSSNRNSVVDQLNEYVSGLFKNIINETIDTYLGNLAEQKGKTIDQYYTDVYNGLQDKATIMFRRRPDAGKGETFSYMSVPRNCSSMIQFFKGKSAQNDIVKESDLKDKIFKINFKACIPLMDYYQLESYEMVYESCLNNPALHLYEPTKEGGKTQWRDIPAPNPSTKWTKEHKSAMMRSGAPGGELQKVETYFGIFDKALEYGYIYQKDNQYHVLVDNGPAIDLDRIIKDNKIDNIESNFIEPADAERAAIAIRSAMHIIKSEGVESFDKNSFEDFNINAEHSLMRTVDGVAQQDVDYTKEFFYKNMRVRDKIKAQVETYERYVYLKGKLENFDPNGVDNFTWMLNLFMTRTVRKNKNKMFVYKDRAGDSKTVYNPLLRSSRFEYFEVFKALMELSDSVRAYLTECSDKIVTEPTDEQFEFMKEWIKLFAEKITEDRIYLKENKASVTGYDEKRAFYDQLYGKIAERMMIFEIGKPEQVEEEDDEDDGIYL